MASDMSTHLPGPPDRLFDGYIFDLDGTMTLGEALLPTAGATVAQLRALGRRTLFLSNYPNRTRAELAARLTGMGLPTPVEDVINSSWVLVQFLRARLPGAPSLLPEQPVLRSPYRWSRHSGSRQTASCRARPGRCREP